MINILENKICSGCGTLNNIHSKYCVNCGTSLLENNIVVNQQASNNNFEMNSQNNINDKEGSKLGIISLILYFFGTSVFSLFSFFLSEDL